MENNEKTPNPPNQQCFSDNSEDMFAHLVVEYLQDLLSQLAVIRRKLETSDYAAIKKDAHRIKGTSGTFQLCDIARSVAELELSAESQDPDAINTAIKAVVHLVEMEKLKRSLPSFIDKSERVRR